MGKREKDTKTLEWTGERYVPWVDDAMVSYEHLHRYRFANEFIKDKKVLDLACGEGYGSFLLAQDARGVVGIDIDETAIQHAHAKYKKGNLKFAQGNIVEIPLKRKNIFDVIICFEALEHIEEHDRLFQEVKRLLKKDGIFMVSTPNKDVYSDRANYSNPFHIKELYLDEFQLLLNNHFKHTVIFGQKVYPASNIFPLKHGTKKTTDYIIEKVGTEFLSVPHERKEARYFIAISSDRSISPQLGNSYLLDISEALYRQAKYAELAGLEQTVRQLSDRNRELEQQITLLNNKLQANCMVKDSTSPSSKNQPLQNNENKILEQYKKTVANGSDNITALKELAEHYSALYRLEESFNTYLKILDIEPNDIEVLQELACLSTQLNRLDDANQYYKRISECEMGSVNANDEEVPHKENQDLDEENANSLKLPSEATSKYENAISNELSRYSHKTNVHDLPAIFHYWSHKYLRPALKSCGLQDIHAVFIKPIVKLTRNGKKVINIASLGSGNCDFEISIVKRLQELNIPVNLHCYELNQDMLDRGRNLALKEGVSKYLKFTAQDINSVHFEQTYQMFMANHSLHHFINLEHIFESIRINLNKGGYFVINDMIGRNGHMRWPEAYEIISKIWQDLDKEKKWNHQLRRYEETFVNWDCSKDGFEGIRAQDILPLLIKYFKFELFIPFANIISVFTDRSFGHNYDPNDSRDCTFIDHVAKLDASLIKEGKLKPTQLIAWMKLENPRSKCMINGMKPKKCIRDPKL